MTPTRHKRDWTNLESCVSPCLREDDSVDTCLIINTVTARFLFLLYTTFNKRNIARWKSNINYQLRVASSDIQVTSSNARVAIPNLRIKSSNARVTSSNLQVTSSDPRATSSNPRVNSWNSRVRRLKAQIEVIKPRVK